jgi:viroplasmin and RNaseH domain-containing protein
MGKVIHIAKSKSKNKYYAIKEGKGVKDKIVNTWTECQKLVLGYPAVYKSFRTKDEAMEYLGTVNVKEQIVKGMESKKKLKATTKVLTVRLDKDLLERFDSKCENIGLTKEIILKGMIEEWLD